MTDTTVLATAQQLGSRSLAWLHDRYQRGYGRLEESTIVDLADPDDVYKPLCEAAMASSLVLRDGVAGPHDARLARELLDTAWSQLNDGTLLYERQLRHVTLIDPLETYGHFARAGYRHAAMEELLDSLGRLRAVHAVEIQGSRRLALANARRIAGLEHQPDWDSLIRSTWLSALPEPWTIAWVIAYQVTHTVFHVTDWGARPECLPEPMRDYLRDWLPVWLDIWLEIEQWDLAAELLVVDSCIGEPVTGRVGWEALAAIQQPDGLIPCEGPAPDHDDPEEAFRRHCHTAVVGVVAANVALSRALGGTPVVA
ncbi:DUF6895 family protein [Streptomyces sp. NRRL S-350]|uniref:DUF6895 family protein n=1 Tax=Streptomyces sp. NRRL S-350 TaxID=1463902 RepID=UPI0004BE9CE2|nr:hypothetical protein [Streptomyces sp. NRRL S-350]